MTRSKLTAADSARIGEVFEAHRRFVEAVAVRELGVHEAADVVQEVGVRLCTSLNGLRAAGAVKSWIYRVTLNVVRAHRRGAAREHQGRARLAVLTSPYEAIVDPDESVTTSRRRDALVDALNRLRSGRKSLICNNYGSDRILLAGGNDRVTAHRTRQRLREALASDPTFKD